MMVVSHTTALSVLGAGLALRGPDGSMMTATDGLYEERTVVFRAFSVGLASTVGSVVLCVWLILRWEGAIVCMSITAYTCYRIWTNYHRVYNRFAYDESETVDFRDIMEGPAAIQAVPTFYYNNRDGQYSQSGNNSRYSKKHSNGSQRQQQRQAPASGTASQSSRSFGNNSQQRSFGERVRNRLRSFNSVDGSNGSISSSYDDDEEAGNLSGGGGGTVEEIELQPLIVDGASNVTKRRGNARSQQQQQPQPASSSLSKQAKAKKDDDAYIIQTV